MPPVSYDKCIIHSNNGGPFGRMTSEDGDNFLILHGRVAVARTLALKAETAYILSFQMSERYGYGDDETLRVSLSGSVDNKVLEKGQNAPQSFTTYAYEFKTGTADDDNDDGDDGGTVKVEVELANISPHAATSSGIMSYRTGHSIFLDSVKVSMLVDCGTGAKCHGSLDADVGYICKCDGRGYVGHDSTNKAAECIDVTTLGGDSDEALAEKVEVLQEEVGMIEEAVGGITVQSKGVAKSVETAAADIVELQAYVHVHTCTTTTKFYKLRLHFVFFL